MQYDFNKIYDFNIKNTLNEWLYTGKNYKRWNDRFNPQSYSVMSNYFFRILLTLENINLKDNDQILKVFDYYYWSYINKLLFGMLKKDVNISVNNDNTISEFMADYFKIFVYKYNFLKIEDIDSTRVNESIKNYNEMVNNKVIRETSAVATYYEYTNIAVNDSKMLESDELQKPEFYKTYYSEFMEIIFNMFNTKRWNGTFLNSKFNIAEHQFHVWVMMYTHYLQTYDSLSTRELNTLIGALLHDLGEYYTGDIISPLKKNIKGFEEILKSLELNGISSLIKFNVINHLGLDFFNNEFNSESDKVDGTTLKKFDIRSAGVEGTWDQHRTRYINSLFNKL